ncbi:Hypothetical predicted protein [Mytilus galloprovincialis]|uniref:Granulins domain-containing protein n=1 Tax=Mytilus galloprovincialis TaxID=29158 RepID=A0A8B6C259_MYTGA|nr:Hypothetical predicted protein [Mytilus galloprovincialis]
MGLVQLTFTISFWILIVNGSCPFEYYQCSEFPDLCCPDGYNCTGSTTCEKNPIYPTSSSGAAIAAGILGGIILIAVVCGVISAAIKCKFYVKCSTVLKVVQSKIAHAMRHCYARNISANKVLSFYTHFFVKVVVPWRNLVIRTTKTKDQLPN